MRAIGMDLAMTQAQQRRLTSANTTKVASEVPSASRSNGTSSASASVAATIRAVAISGVAVFGCTRPAKPGRSPWRAAVDDARGHRHLRQDGVEGGDDGDDADGGGTDAGEPAEHQT